MILREAMFPLNQDFGASLPSPSPQISVVMTTLEEHLYGKDTIHRYFSFLTNVQGTLSSACLFYRNFLKKEKGGGSPSLISSHLFP